MSAMSSGTSSVKILETVDEDDEDSVIAVKKSDRIVIRRSDGVKHDVVAAFNKPGYEGLVQAAINNKIERVDSLDDNSRHTISFPRSDGIGHDIQAVLRTTSEKNIAITKDKEKAAPSRFQAIKSRVSFLSLGTSKQSAKNNILSTPVSPANTNAAIPLERNIITKEFKTYVNNHPSHVRIVHMSDTFNFLKPSNKKNFLPHGDILVHSGNFTIGGTDEEFQLFDNWLKSVKDVYHYRVICLGHRDVRRFGVEWDIYRGLLPNATHVLCHEEATILGIKFYVCPWHWGYKFNYTVKPTAPSSVTFRFNEIPDSVQVLVTHGPAYGRLDSTYEGEHWGSRELLDSIKTIKPGLHLHGHLADSRGIIPAFGHLPLTVNSAMCERSRKIMYGCPHVVKCSQIFSKASDSNLKAHSSWEFSIDVLEE